MQHVGVSRITGDPPRLGDAIGFLAGEVGAAAERQPGSLGTSLLAGSEAGALRFESFWVAGCARTGRGGGRGQAARSG